MKLSNDKIIMEKLGLTELRHYIAQTNRGEITLMIRKNESEYHLLLDAVPIEPSLNKELMSLLFPPKIEIPEVNKGNPIYAPQVDMIKALNGNIPKPPKKPIKPKKK